MVLGLGSYFHSYLLCGASKGSTHCSEPQALVVFNDEPIDKYLKILGVQPILLQCLCEQIRGGLNLDPNAIANQFIPENCQRGFYFRTTQEGLQNQVLMHLYECAHQDSAW